MSFETLINHYLNILDCNANDLAIHSNISPSILSRYRSGERVPKYNSEKIKMLINGIIDIAKEKEIPDISLESIVKEFRIALGNNDFKLENLIGNINVIINDLNINISKLSRFLGYDPSYLSKIRSGLRNPRNTNLFVDKLCQYILSLCTNNELKIRLYEIINVNEKNTNNEDLLDILKNWLYYAEYKTEDPIDTFLKDLDDFNLEEYIKVIHFDELKVPTIPIKMPKSKNYYGLEEIKMAELDFLKNTVLSKNNNNLFMCSDMQIDDMAKDVKWAKKWMFGLAMVIKKGLHIIIIHNLDRPFNEMMLGLESWIPLYMTGQVSPYYFKNNQSKIFSQLNYTSGEYALYGECIKGFHSDSKYYLTNNAKEVEYYKKKADILLSKASPAMEIYTIKEEKKLQILLSSDVQVSGKRKRVLTSLPIETMDEKLLISILNNNKLSNSETKKALAYYKKTKIDFESIIKNNMYTDKIHLLSEEEFEKSDIVLSLDKCFLEKKINYTFEEYIEHFEQTKAFEKKHKNYKVIINTDYCFKNIDIYINENAFVMISKKKNPNIHFIIKHEKLKHAIESFVPMIVEQ